MVKFRKVKEWYGRLANLYCSFLIKWYAKQERKYKREWIVLVNKIPTRWLFIKRFFADFYIQIRILIMVEKRNYRSWKFQREKLKDWKEWNE